MLSVEQRVKIVISKHLDVNPQRIKNNSSITELGADSLDTVELTMALEEEFNIEISDQDANRMKTVSDITKYIESRLKLEQQNKKQSISNKWRVGR